ncbi:YolD-like family protein [Bacillus lacus]|uniref:YolD-like family protein n=2 Tax=Metabacillus lacus TaxID=1983721 RepID=A0A7X2J331_9BACI|nr:YolD-like family protein [Metabacillus lacus]
MIRDRGNIKWTAMMLPEHVKLLREWQESDRYQSKPELDEQKLEEFNEVICLAMENNSYLLFTYYKSGEFRQVKGHVHFVDALSGTLRMIKETGERLNVQMQSIVDVQIIE